MENHKIKDPGSAITHFIGLLMAVVVATPLIVKAMEGINRSHTMCFVVFIMSMVMLYGASTTYHTFDVSDKVNLYLKKMDHAMIFVLIAGSYTPICVIVIGGALGYGLLALVWSVAVLGIIFKLLWVTCPRWISSVMYIAMGWICVFAMSPIVKNLPAAAFGWLLAGGIIYTVGGVIYALKLPIFNSKHKNFGSHEIFHLFCLGGSICHFILMYVYLA